MFLLICIYVCEPHFPQASGGTGGETSERRISGETQARQKCITSPYSYKTERIWKRSVDGIYELTTWCIVDAKAVRQVFDPKSVKRIVDAQVVR